MTEVFDYSRPHPCERLARWSGQTNYWVVVDGNEIGADTTQDAAALAFAQSHTRAPTEVLAAYWGGAYRMPLAQAILASMRARGMRDKDKDRIKVKAAILHGVDRFIGKEVERYPDAAKRARMKMEAFMAVSHMAEGIAHAWLGEAQPEWIKARLR